ncbi:thiamine-phosphate kinase [Alteribacillus iranensis]|uniref:Thiamine-monophosphate kinase n=1 Tax=Alteribacillus iranensis TaxID=930128 RepID=A0A1I2ECZ8_9BACI|nr:thiamine-phosphate kinase [Alteribacillus iranensis]SFE90513.1 thiamine-phosphate kinase [Alteribacillus iranensis]
MPRDEFVWINKQRPSKYFDSHIIEGIGDDTAVYSSSDDFDELLCVDTLIEDIHFKKSTMAPEDIGHKALAVNISDIAAMGGIPTYYMVAIAVPTTWSDDELEGIYRGMTELGIRYKMDMIGGDTVSSPRGLMISVTVRGKVEKGRALLRKNAKPGDLVFLTNTTGRSAAGLSLLLDKGRHGRFSMQESELVQTHQRPEPRVQEGRAAAKIDPLISLNDISDGLASELNELAEASNTSIELWETHIPIAKELKNFPEKNYWDWIFYGGEDFELVGTVRESDWPILENEIEKTESQLYVIGRVLEGNPLVTLLGEKRKTILEKKGYNHFKQ